MFRDRADAGRQLAVELASYASDAPVVLALPRGGVVTAYEIATALNAPLDVLIVRKLGALSQPEFGVGAIAAGGVKIVDPASVRMAGMDEDDVARVVLRETRELVRRESLYRADRGPLELKGRTVILVDDGAATGVTALAAVRAARKLGAAHVILALGVCAAQTAARLRREVDDLVALIVTDDLVAVGLYYEDFSQIDDNTVIDLLARRALPVPA